MASTSEDSTAREPRRPPSTGFRFTLGGMLAVTAAAAVVAAALFAFPPVVSGAIAGMMAVCLPAMLVGCLIYGGPGWRAFAVGMLVPTALRLASGLLGGTMGGGGYLSASRLMSQQYMQQQIMLSRAGRGFVQPGGLGESNAISYFEQLAQTWDKLGYAYMTDETLFWGASAIAGLATLLVQQRFARSLRSQPRSGESA